VEVDGIYFIGGILSQPLQNTASLISIEQMLQKKKYLG
jgi:hypothetical protein